MMVSTPGDVPEYELNPAELQFRRGQEVPTVRFSLSNIQFCFFCSSNVCFENRMRFRR
jgi:hypothetical protein